MKASINGRAQSLPDGMTVAQLLAHLRTPLGGVAVAKNDCIVLRSEFERETVSEGDRVEIIKAAAGG